MQDQSDEQINIRGVSSQETKYLSWITLKPQIFKKRRALAQKRLKETKQEDIRKNPQLRKLIDDDHQIIRYNKDIDFSLSTYEVSNLFAYRVIWFNDQRFRNEIVSYPHFYLKLWENDMPVLITIDSIIYPFHQSYERILEQLQIQILTPLIQSLLIKLIINCSQKREENEKYIDALEYFLVCLYLLQTSKNYNQEKVLSSLMANFCREDDIFISQNTLLIIQVLKLCISQNHRFFTINLFCQNYQIKNPTWQREQKMKVLKLSEEEDLNLRYQRCLNLLMHVPIDVTENPQTMYALAYILNEDLETRHLYEALIKFYGKIYNTSTQLDLIDIIDITHDLKMDDNIALSFVDYKNLIQNIKTKVYERCFIIPLEDPDQLEQYQFMSFFPRHMEIDDDLQERLTGSFMDGKWRFEISMFEIIYSVYNNINLMKKVRQQMKGTNDDQIPFRDGVNIMGQLDQIRIQIASSMETHVDKWRKSIYLLWHLIMKEMSNTNNYQTYGESLCAFKSKFWIDKNAKLQINSFAQAQQSFGIFSEKVRLDPEACGYKDVAIEANFVVYKELNTLCQLFKDAYQEIMEDHFLYFKNKKENLYNEKSVFHIGASKDYSMMLDITKEKILQQNIREQQEQSVEEEKTNFKNDAKGIRILQDQFKKEGIQKIRNEDFITNLQKTDEYQCILKIMTAIWELKRICQSLSKLDKLEQADEMFLSQLIYGSSDSYKGVSFDGWYVKMFYQYDKHSIFKSYSRISKVLEFPPRQWHDYAGMKTYIAEQKPRVGIIVINGKAFLFATANPSEITFRQEIDDFIDFKEWQDSLNYSVPQPNTSKVIKDFVQGTSQYNTSSDTTVVQKSDIDEIIEDMEENQNNNHSQISEYSYIQ